MAAVVVTEPVTEGRVLLKTSIGDVLIELWARETPKACRNFVQLCLEGYYDGCLFHRVVPGFIAQTGDDTGTGTGGECIYDEGTFADEFNQRLKPTRRGLVAMANQGSPNTNMSQFLFTLDRAPELEQQNTIFGRVAGDTLFNVLKLNEVELEPSTDKPVYPPKIVSTEVLDNPFEDIVPRITAAERKEQARAKREMKRERAQEKLQGKRKGTKNRALLSFGDEPEEPIDPTFANAKFKSSHDVLTDDPRLRKEVIDDRGTLAELPLELQEGGLAAGGPPKEKRPRTESQAVASGSGESKRERVKESKAQPEQSASDRVREQIAKVEADLKKMARGADGSDDEGESSKKPKKVKRTGPSLLQLEREKYTRGAGASKKKGKKEDLDLGDMLAGFRAKISAASTDAPRASEGAQERDPTLYGILMDDEDDDDSGWLSHELKFRKDATEDVHKAEEYAVHDPLAKNALSLAEMQQKQDDRRRYAGERDNRRGGGHNRHSDRRDERDRRDRDGPRQGFGGEEGRSQNTGSWKDQRMGRETLA